nr:transglutaminase-like domain-containing protein [Lachnospiraceae bacterium]
EVVNGVYNYIIKHITYDYQKADTVKSGYLTNVDEILLSGTGICLDYSAVMTSMLRSQRIPTRLEVGYAGEVYHAWISIYITDVGWLNGIIQFNGKEWELVDPTFGASTNEKQLKSYIGDGSNYATKYIY